MLLYINGNYPNHSLHRELVCKLAEMGENITVFAPIRRKEYDGLYPCNHPRVRIIYSNCINCFDRFLFLFKIHKIARIIEQQIDMSKVDYQRSYGQERRENLFYQKLCLKPAEAMNSSGHHFP